jgi:hypothetical protein
MSGLPHPARARLRALTWSRHGFILRGGFPDTFNNVGIVPK